MSVKYSENEQPQAVLIVPHINENYRHILAKLSVTSRTEAVALAVRHHLVD